MCLLVHYKRLLPNEHGAMGLPLQGWQLLIHSSMECLAAIHAGQQQPQPVNSASTASTSDETSMVASLGSKVSVQLHATQLVAELIANTQHQTVHDTDPAAYPGRHLSVFVCCMESLLTYAAYYATDFCLLSFPYKHVTNSCHRRLVWVKSREC